MRTENYSGIDEAGLGPILGPFCSALTTFNAPEDLKELLEEYQKKLFYVDDSKKVYQGKYGLKRLEDNVLAFYYLLKNEIPTNINSFIPSLNAPWHLEENLELPVKSNPEEIVDMAGRIGELFITKGIQLIDIKRSAVTPLNFNKLLNIWENKSIACSKIISPLLSSALNEDEPHNIVVDKQGGRKFYKDYLDELTGKNWNILSEEKNNSIYKLDKKSISFTAKADGNYFQVALSSMFAKYMREISMSSFNRYWDIRVPGIKPTAGYYTDGIRFIKELENANVLPENRDLIIRKK